MPLMFFTISTVELVSQALMTDPAQPHTKQGCCHPQPQGELVIMREGIFLPETRQQR